MHPPDRQLELFFPVVITIAHPPDRRLDFFFSDVIMIAHPPDRQHHLPKKGGMKYLGVCSSLKILFAIFTNLSIQQQQKTATQTHPQHTATTKMSRLCPASAAPPTHCATAPYGPTQGARDWVWPRHGWFPCWGGKMKTQQKIERGGWFGLRWPKLHGKTQQPAES